MAALINLQSLLLTPPQTLPVFISLCFCQVIHSLSVDFGHCLGTVVLGGVGCLLFVGRRVSNGSNVIAVSFARQTNVTTIRHDAVLVPSITAIAAKTTPTEPHPTVTEVGGVPTSSKAAESRLGVWGAAAPSDIANPVHVAVGAAGSWQTPSLLLCAQEAMPFSTR